MDLHAFAEIGPFLNHEGFRALRTVGATFRDTTPIVGGFRRHLLVLGGVGLELERCTLATFP